MLRKKPSSVALMLAVCGFLLCAFVSIKAQEVCSGNSIFTAKACRGDDISTAEKNLFELVNKYRSANGKRMLRLSTALSMVGNRRMLDLNQNLKKMTHSWSNCHYEITDQKTWPCLTEAPQRLNSGYKGAGYETLYRTMNKVSPDAALEAWKKSSLHSSIILNQSMFENMPWDEMGVAIDGSYAALWFGYPGGRSAATTINISGLGVSLDQTISGFSRSLSSGQGSGNAIWQGISADKTVKLDVFGTRNEVTGAAATISNPTGRLDAAKRQVLTTLLKNIFPEWNDVEQWVDNSLAQIAQNPTAWRTKVVRKLAVDLKGEGYSTIKLTVKPQSSTGAIEIY